MRKLTVAVFICRVKIASTAVHGVFTTLVKIVVRPRIRQPWIVNHVGSKQAWPTKKGDYIFGSLL